MDGRQTVLPNGTSLCPPFALKPFATCSTHMLLFAASPHLPPTAYFLNLKFTAVLHVRKTVNLANVNGQVSTASSNVCCMCAPLIQASNHFAPYRPHITTGELALSVTEVFL